MEKDRNIQLLTKEFCRIKKMGLVKSLRRGTTGIGYTFETLINKSEDQECKPDFEGIEIKSRFGYSKSDLSLFNCEPLRNDVVSKNYIFENYSYYRYGNYNDYRLFQRKIFANFSMCINNYEFKLKIDYNEKKIFMITIKNNQFVENVCWWDFKTLEEKLVAKLSLLAIVKAYPYTKNGESYYKYTRIDYYRLKGFNCFLKLIEQNKIFVSVYLREGLNKIGDSIIENHGSCFKIKWNSIDNLFEKLDY